jgi:predicted HAD superfamily hydrolase
MYMFFRLDIYKKKADSFYCVSFLIRIIYQTLNLSFIRNINIKCCYIYTRRHFYHLVF